MLCTLFMMSSHQMLVKHNFRLFRFLPYNIPVPVIKQNLVTSIRNNCFRKGPKFFFDFFSLFSFLVLVVFRFLRILMLLTYDNNFISRFLYTWWRKITRWEEQQQVSLIIIIFITLEDYWFPLNAVNVVWRESISIMWRTLPPISFLK